MIWKPSSYEGVSGDQAVLTLSYPSVRRFEPTSGHEHVESPA